MFRGHIGHEIRARAVFMSEISGHVDSVAFMSDRLPLNNTSLLKELRHDILRLANNLYREGNHKILTQKNTKDEIINQEGMRMTKDGED